MPPEYHGEVRSFHVARINGATLKPILREQIAKDANLMTDEHGGYNGLGKEFASHEVVRHSAKEYARGSAHTNTIEGFLSILTIYARTMELYRFAFGHR